MPFKSEKQRKWMWANDPEMAEKWEKKEADEIDEGAKIMKMTMRQLRQIIREGIDILNNETGELLIFDDSDGVDADGHTIGADAPEAAARDILRRLQITPIDSEIDGDIETIEVSPEDWAVMDVELRGKRRYRKNKREQERLNVDNLMDRVHQWAAEAGADYGADNPEADIEGISLDLAKSAQYAFAPDEWEALLSHWDTQLDIDDPCSSEDALLDYVACSIVG